MGGYISYNLTENDVYIKLAGPDHPHMVIPHGSLNNLLFDPDSVYKVKKDHHTLAKFWTDASGYVVKYHNYDHKTFITVKYVLPNVTQQKPAEIKTKLGFTDTQYMPTFIIDKKHKKVKLVVP
jgi:hypothetical protein